MSTFRGTSKVQAGTAGARGTRTSIRFATLLLAALLALAITVALAPRAEAYVYWIGEHGEPGTIESAPAIGRANLDGSGVKRDFVALPRQDARRGLAVGDTHLYWTNPDASGLVGDIGRAKLDGTGADQSFIADVEMSGLSSAGGVAVDEEHVYWVSKVADDFGSKPSSGAIGRANLDGTGVDENFITGVSFPSGAVAVDESHLYWTIDWPSGFLYDVPDLIGRANLDGTGVEEGFIDAPAVAAVTVDDTHVWWSSSDRFGLGPIMRAKLDGTGIETVIWREDFGAGEVAVDGTHVYWRGGFSSNAGMPIGRAKRDGTRVNYDFITGITLGGGLAVDGLGPPPSNEFAFAGVKKNKKKGTAKLTVKVPGPGELALARNAKVKGRQKGADAAGRQKLPIKPRRKAKQKLAAKGKAKVKAEVTYTPDGGEPNSHTKRLRLIKRR
jgi:hypothetical protein